MPVLLGWLCGWPLPPTFLFQGGAAAVFGFVVQALDLLLPGLHVFVYEMKDGWGEPAFYSSGLPAAAHRGSFSLGTTPPFTSHRRPNTA